MRYCRLRKGNFRAHPTTRPRRRHVRDHTNASFSVMSTYGPVDSTIDLLSPDCPFARGMHRAGRRAASVTNMRVAVTNMRGAVSGCHESCKRPRRYARRSSQRDARVGVTAHAHTIPESHDVTRQPAQKSTPAGGRHFGGDSREWPPSPPPSHAAESGNGARRICIDPPPPARRVLGA